MDNKAKFHTKMILPKGAKKAWSNIMYGETPIKDSLNEEDVIVEASAIFEDGTYVKGGVLASDTPTDYNIIFMRVFNKEGIEYPYVIDVGDYEDFYTSGFRFAISDDDDYGDYEFDIIEADE